MKIGTFEKTEDGQFHGQIKTLTKVAALVLYPNEDKTTEKAPDYRIVSNQTGAECGAAWNMMSQDDKPYISVKLDDPSFANTLWANLSKDEDGQCHLYWDRPKRKTQRDSANFETL